jgi:hypothetical protein
MAPAMIPVFAVGEAGKAIRLLEGRAALVSAAYIGTTWLPEEKLSTLLEVVCECTKDCGAFTRWQRRLKGECEACGKKGMGLAQRLCEPCDEAGKILTVESWAQDVVANAARFKRFIALDEIGDAQASLDNWIELLRLVPRDLHHQLMPVWHEGDPIEHLQEYDPGSRLVAIGRTKGRQAGNAGRKATRVFYDEAFNEFPEGDFWALGNGNPETLQPYPFSHFDQTTWERDSAYGESHGWPWSAVSKDTRMRAYIEATESICYRPQAPSKQVGFEWAKHDGA